MKTDFGTLLLTGNNSYSGGTEVRGGVQAVASDANLGAAAGGLTLNAGSFSTFASFGTARAITLTQSGGGIDVATGTQLGLDGPISGSGDLRKLGTGTLVLGGNTTQLFVETG